jgi:hypothetical protein
MNGLNAIQAQKSNCLGGGTPSIIIFFFVSFYEVFITKVLYVTIFKNKRECGECL